MRKTRTLIGVLLFLSACVLLAQGGYIHAKAWLAQILLEQAWQRSLQGESRSKPWPWSDSWPVARLQVPRLEIDLIVLADDSGRSLAFGPGHHHASATPGREGNSIISAHRDTHFKFLQQLKQGDSIFTEIPQQQRQHFTVTETRVIQQDRAVFMEQPSQALLHLVTCYPFDTLIPGGQQRYIVSAIANNSTVTDSF